MWSGGTTTELAIYPVGATYPSGQFLWRVSTATVDASPSAFSPLPGVTRTLMLLEGDLWLRHESHEGKHLRPFDQATFDGRWTTQSQGTGTDFNLMCTHGVSGEVAALTMVAGEIRYERAPKHPSRPAGWLLLYAWDGDFSLRCGNDEGQLRRGEVLVMEEMDDCGPFDLVITHAGGQVQRLIRCTIHRDSGPVPGQSRN